MLRDFKMKKLLLFVFSFVFAFNTKAQQNIAAEICNSKLPNNAHRVLLVYPSGDCFKCVAPFTTLSKLLKQQEVEPSFIILSDNYLKAKELIATNELNAAIEVSDSLMNLVAPDSKARIFVEENTNQFKEYLLKDIVADVQQEMLSHFHKANTNIIEIKDSVFTKNKFQTQFSTLGILLFEKSIQYFGFINNGKITYHKPTVQEPQKLIQLPSNIDWNKNDQPQKELQEQLYKITGLPMVKVNNVQIDTQLNKVYCFFTLTRFSVKKSNHDDANAFMTNFIGVKDIKQKQDFENIHDISSYNKFHTFDSILYNGMIFYPFINTDPAMKSVLVENGNLFIKSVRKEYMNDTTVTYGTPMFQLKLEDTNIIIKSFDTTITLGGNYTPLFINDKIFILNQNFKSANNCFENYNSNHIYFYSNSSKHCMDYLLGSFVNKDKIEALAISENLGLCKFSIETNSLKFTTKQLFSKAYSYFGKINDQFLFLKKEMIDTKFNYGIIKIESQSVAEVLK